MWRMTIFTLFFSLFWLQILNLPASLQNKNTRIGAFPWKRSVLQNPDQEGTNQSTGICLRQGLPHNNSWYCRLTFAACAALKWVADVRKQIAAAFKWLYKYFTSSSTVFIENSTFTIIIKLLHHWETPVQMLCLYNTSNLKKLNFLFNRK